MKITTTNLDYSFETGMVNPPEGLFYIEMDQAPPGRVEAVIVCSAGGSGELLFICSFLLSLATYYLIAGLKLTLSQMLCRCEWNVTMTRSAALRSPYGFAQACIAQFTCQLRNTFSWTRRSGWALFFCPSTFDKLGHRRISFPNKPEWTFTKCECQPRECIWGVILLRVL